MLKAAYRILLVLIVFAVIGGPVAQLAQPAAASMAPMAMGAMPCDMAMPMADAGDGAPMAPCKGMTPECIKQMGCVANAALPIRLADGDTTFAFSLVAYWFAQSEMTGMAHEPEPLPPRTA